MKVIFSGILLHEGGYSELSRNIVVCLEKAGVLVGIDARDRTMILRAPPTGYVNQEFQEIYDKYAKQRVYMQEPDTLVQMVPPFMMIKPSGKVRNIGITMFETRVPEKWFQIMAEKKLDRLLLHDEYQDELFMGTLNNLEKRRWRPWVLEPQSLYPPISTPNLLPRKYILSVGVARVHKNQRKLIMAFLRLKEQKRIDEEVELIIKTLKEDYEGDEFRDLLVGRSDIRVLTGPISSTAIDYLYRNASLYVCPTMCEGLNMPAIKSAMCGVPVVLGHHTGHQWMRDLNIPRVELSGQPVDMSTIPKIHPRYREGDMTGYAYTVEEIMDRISEALNGMGWIFNPDPICEYFGEKESTKSLLAALD